MKEWMFVIASILAIALFGSVFISSCEKEPPTKETPPDQTGTYPKNHKPTWDCYICHSTDFFGSPGEPHERRFTAPNQCTNCHIEGDWINSPHGPVAHNFDQDCLTCHTSQHDATWQEKDQCLVCHQSGAAAPMYPKNHDGAWDCYICHETNFMEVTKAEPHEHNYDAPDECTFCHKLGDWTNPYYAGGHNWSENCLSCHGNRHDRTWQNKSQCLVCHGGGDDEDDDKKR